MEAHYGYEILRVFFLEVAAECFSVAVIIPVL
jgi:hypothetical protein